MCASENIRYTDEKFGGNAIAFVRDIFFLVATKVRHFIVLGISLDSWC